MSPEIEQEKPLVGSRRRRGRHRSYKGPRPRVGVTAAAALAWLMAVGPGMLPAQTASELYRQGLAAQQAGRLEEAARNYEAALRLAPNSLQARSNLGAVLSAMGRYADAIRQYGLALEIQPDNALVRLNRAVALYKMADFAQAAEELLRVRERLPDNRQALLLLADCQLRLGENAKVIVLLEPLLEASPDDDGARYLLGTALIRDRQVAKGQSIIDPLLRRGDSAEVLVLVGAAQLGAGEYQAALGTIRKAEVLNRRVPGLQTLLGTALMENDDNEGAKRAFREALSQDPNDFEANLRLGALLRIENELPEATRYIDRALTLRPASLLARYQMGSIRLSSGDAAAARQLLESVVKDDPEYVEGHVQLAQAYFRLGMRDEGQRERQIVLELQEKSRRKELDRQKKP